MTQGAASLRLIVPSSDFALLRSGLLVISGYVVGCLPGHNWGNSQSTTFCRNSIGLSTLLLSVVWAISWAWQSPNAPNTICILSVPLLLVRLNDDNCPSGTKDTVGCRKLQSISLYMALDSNHSIYFCKIALCQKPPFSTKSLSVRPSPLVLTLLTSC